MQRFLWTLSLFILLTLVPLSALRVVIAQGGLPAPEEVTIPGVVEKTLKNTKTTDIKGTFYGALSDKSAKAPAILMLPQLTNMSQDLQIEGDRKSLEHMALLFQKHGVNALSIDLSGYYWDGGKSPSMVDGFKDVEAAYHWLRSHPNVDPSRIAVLGSSIGANYSLMLIEQFAEIVAGFILSPAPDYGGVTVNPETLTSSNVWVYAGQDEAANTDYNAWLSQNPNFTTPGTGHGDKIFNEREQLEQQIILWVQLMMAKDNVRPEETLEYLQYLFRTFCCSMPFLLVLQLFIPASRFRLRLRRS